MEREYLATVDNPIDEAALRKQLAEGVETIEDGESLVVQGELLAVDGQIVRAIFREGKYRMVRRVLANCGHPVVELHRLRYGKVRLDELDIDEGESAPIEGEALEWLLSLKPSAEAETTPAAAESSSPSPPPPPSPPSPPPPPPSPRDLVAEMEEAKRREYQPPEKMVDLVVQEGDCTREEALEALRRHDGDIVAALEDVLET